MSFQDIPEPAFESAVNIWLLVPTGNLIKVEPFPTSKSPLVYEVYPVPPYIAETALPAHVPEVIVLLLCPTPEIDEKFVVAVHKLPPIPTPPSTIKAPVVVFVEAVEEVTWRVLLKCEEPPTPTPPVIVKAPVE